MKYKIPFFFLLYCVFVGTLNSQGFETKTYKLNGFGILNIPNVLDTLGQDISKKFMIENTLENISVSGKKTIENEYQINLTKMFLSNYDTSVILFWPRYSLLYLFDSDLSKKSNSDSSLNTETKQFSVVPNILLQRKKYIYNSSQIKQLYLKKEEKEEYASKFAEAYTSMISTLFTSINISNVSSNYFLFLNNYPAVKISFKYTVLENNTTSNYNQDLYTIYKGDYNYLLRFEYRSEEENKWKLYVDQFFKEIKLF